MMPLFKSIYYIILIASLICCYYESFAVYNLQRYFLMLQVVTETVTRTAIGVFFFLIAKVSRKRVLITFSFEGMGHSSIRFRPVTGHALCKVPGCCLHHPQFILYHGGRLHCPRVDASKYKINLSNIAVDFSMR